MVISFRARHPVFRTDEKPGTVTIDVPKDTIVRALPARGAPPRSAPAAATYKGPALDRYRLPPGRWIVGPDWLVEVFRNGKKKPWSVAIRYRRPFASVTIPDYEPPQPSGGLRLVKG